MMSVTAVSVVFIRDLFAVILLFGIYSLVSAVFFLNLDAPDVALTEAAIGAGIAPMLMLGTLALVRDKIKPEEKKSGRRVWLPILSVALLGSAMIYATFDMPAFGDPDAPAHTHVAKRYIEQTGTEIGIPNMVTAILAGYRGYDTMGEVVVIFAAGLGVLSLLGIWMGKTSDALKSKNIHMRQHLVLRVLTKILIPPILLFALYVQFHGEYSPGGGFQAGVIFAAAFILYSLVYGLNMTFKIVSTKLLRNGMALGVLIFGGVGVAALCLGGNFLDYSVLHSNPLTGQMIGIMLVELGVGITVACVMMSVLFNFSKRSAALEDEDQPL